MAHRGDGKEIHDNLLSSLSLYVKKNSGYEMKFVEKSMEQTIDLSIYVNPDWEIDKEVTYYKDKEESEKKHIKIVGTAFYIFSGFRV